MGSVSLNKILIFIYYLAKILRGDKTLTESKPNRRMILKYVMTGAICGVIAGVGGYVAGLTAVPSPRTVTETITTTITKTVTVTPSPPSGPEYIKIGLEAPLTGPLSQVGSQMLQGAIIAIEEINAKGGVYVREFGRRIPIKLVTGDDKGVPEEGVAAVKKMIFVDKVTAIVGTYDLVVGVATIPIATENRVPYMVSFGPSIAEVIKDKSYVFHYEIHLFDWTGDPLDFFTEVLKPKVAPNRNLRVAFLAEDSLFGEVSMMGFNYNLKNKKLPIDFVAVEKYEKFATDLHAYLTKVKASDPDVVVMIATPDVAQRIQVQGIRDLNFRTFYFGIPCNEDPAYYKMLGEFGDYQLQNSRFTAFQPYKPIAAKFIEEYKKRWGELPGMMSANCYDMVKLVAYTIESVGTLDREVIRDFLEKIDIPANDFLAPAKGNRIKWDENHELHMSSFVEQLRYNKETGLIPYVIWGPPEVKKQRELEIPPWYTIKP